MSVLTSEVKAYRSAVVGSGGTNGGRMSSTEIPDGETGGFWPDIFEAERTAGSTLRRKEFVKFASAGDDPAYNVRLLLFRPTEGDEAVYLYEGDQEDTQADLGTPDLYGCGQLNANVGAGATSITVAVEDGAVIIFRDTEKILISNKTNSEDTGGTEEWATISGTPSVVSDVVTITLASPLGNAYSASNTYVASAIEIGTVQAGFSDKTVTSAAGTFTEANAVAYAIGAVYTNLTFTFTSASNFTCAGDDIGSLGSGNISSTFAPTNADFGSAYFSIPSSVWGGTFQSGDTVEITLSPAAAPLWAKRVTPAGAGTISLSQIWIRPFWS